MPIAITGASGFVGLNIVEQALSRGRDVVAFDLLPIPADARAWFAKLPGRFVEYTGDVTDREARRRFLGHPGIAVLIHAAAITPDAARERAFPGSILAVNTAAALDCIAEAVDRGIRRIVAVSSVSAYGMVPAALPSIDEDTPLAPFNLYGVSKLALERGLQRLRDLVAFDLRVARLSPQFGRWEWRSGKRDALSALLQCLAAADGAREAVLPRDVTIDWLYAADAADALLLLADEASVPGDTFNVGSGDRFKLSDWCRAIEASVPGFRWRIDADAPNIVVNPGFDRPPQSIARLNSIGWRPKFGLAAALADYRDFARVNPAFAPARQSPAAA